MSRRDDTAVSEAITSVVDLAHFGGFSVKSDTARSHAGAVAAAASLGLISTWNGRDGSFGTMWRPTVSGLAHLTGRLATRNIGGE